MDCFYHPDTTSVGLCKSCYRGLCRECAVEFPRGLACRGKCEENVQQVIELVQRNVKLTRSLAKNAPGNRIVMFVLGAFVLLFGALFIWASFLGEHPIWILLALGVLVSSYGLFMVIRAYRFHVPL